MANLFSNAADCTQDGEVVLEASADRNYITVVIRDTGEGVAPELLPRVFERGVSGKGGKGYGLAISKTIIEAHGGTIEIDNNEGGGAAVTFSIPVYGGQGNTK
jgi:signal transduction histidine kinase